MAEVPETNSRSRAMNNFNRLLSRKDKSRGPHGRDKSTDGMKKEGIKKYRPRSGEGIWSLFRPERLSKEGKEAKDDNEEIADKVQILAKQLEEKGITTLGEEQIEYALKTKHANGDVAEAYELLILFQESVDGVVKPYDPDIHMLGAENRQGVTCYLDSILSAMFARLGSFEPILHANFEDEPRRRLVTLIRLWVNLLRTGKLIQTDFTKVLQDALVACGWEEAGDPEQQDTSEAFSFITEKLELPLLTLKMDIYHTGAEDAADDHKLIHERLLEVAVPEPSSNGKPIQLEDCLEEYFNNRIEVVRRLERTNTTGSIRSGTSPLEEKQSLSAHIGIMEVSSSGPNSPAILSSTISLPPTPGPEVAEGSRKRAPSFIRHRMMPEEEENGDKAEHRPISPRLSMRKGSIRKEVLMPAWQFFSLIPWYTENIPTNDAQVAAHFSSSRPVLGICLKRYAMTNDGAPIRKNTYIDIPLQIALPHFIQDDKSTNSGGPLFGNFKLCLQSVVCHRGSSVHEGHYISLVRSAAQNVEEPLSLSRVTSNNSELPGYAEDKWLKFDDIADERVEYVDIGEALKTEMPYLLFYQVQPLYDVSPPTTSQESKPPSYTDSAIAMTRHEPTGPLADSSKTSILSGYFDGPNGEPKPIVSFSEEVDRPRMNLTRPSSSAGDTSRRGSIANTEISLGSIGSTRPSDGNVEPVTPGDEASSTRASRPSTRFGKSGSKSRPTSQAGENRISATFSRMTLRRSRDPIAKSDHVSTASVGADLAAAVEGRQKLDVGSVDSEVPSDIRDGTTTSRKHKSVSRERLQLKDVVHQQIAVHKGKGQAKEAAPDRECTIM